MSSLSNMQHSHSHLPVLFHEHQTRGLLGKPGVWILKGGWRQHGLHHAANLPRCPRVPHHGTMWARCHPTHAGTRHPEGGKQSNLELSSSRRLSSEASSVVFQGTGLQAKPQIYGTMRTLRIPEFAAPKIHCLTSLLSEWFLLKQTFNMCKY